MFCPICDARRSLADDWCRECGAYLRLDELSGLHVAAPHAPEARTSTPARDPSVLRDALALHLSLPGADGASGPPVADTVAGGRVELELLLRNQSQLTRRLEIGVTGLPRAWWSAEPPVVHLNPLESRPEEATALVTVRLQPPRGSEAEAGAWPFTVLAGAEGRAAGTLRIAPFHDLRVKARPERRAGRRAARFELEVENRGNAGAVVFPLAEDAEHACRLRLEPAGVDVRPGDRATAALEVRPKRTRWIGRPVTRKIALSAGPEPLEPCVLTPSLEFRQRAWIPAWVAAAVPLLAVAATAFALTRPQLVTVPELRGAPSAFAAQQQLEAAGLRIAAPQVRESAEAQPGGVVDQTPAAGTRVKRGAQLTVVVAQGTASVEVPDLAGRTVQEADVLLAEAGLRLGVTRPELDYDATIEAQLPAAGQERKTGTPVDITLAVAPAPTPTPTASPTPTPTPTATATAPVLAYDDGRNLQLTRPDGGADPLTSGGDATQPAWHPDGDALAYRREVRGRGRIHLIHPARGDAPGVALTSGTGDDGRPAFSPDGSTLAFIRKPAYDLCLLTVASAPGPGTCEHDDRWAFNRPAWGPDGDAIAVLAVDREKPAEAGVFLFTRDGDGDGWAPQGLVMRVRDPQYLAWAPSTSLALMAGPQRQAAQLTLVPSTGAALDVAAARALPIFGCEVAWVGDDLVAVSNRACAPDSGNGELLLAEVGGDGRRSFALLGANPAMRPS